MLFSSPLFLFVFFPAVLLVYTLAHSSRRNTILLVASLLFYAWGEPRFVGVVLLSSLGDWLIGRRLYQSAAPRQRRLYLLAGVSLNLALLLYFKYANFFVANVNSALGALHLHPSFFTAIALPLGVSFIVFEKITYIVDIYRKTGTPADRLDTYLLYVLFFPKLLAGPIIKYHDIAEQLRSRQSTINDMQAGIMRFCVGLAKKVILADTLGRVTDKTFALTGSQLGFHNAWLGVVCFTLQIYFDFSGYSDMAIGLARMFGFRLQENFNMPYVATSFTDFWRRWHISLSTWIREYLYFPLGGNRVSLPRAYFNLWICFFLSGLWHGAKWTFILWGVYHGCFMMLDKLFWLRIQRKLPGWVSAAITLLLIMFSWVIFRADTAAQAAYYLRALVPGQGASDTFMFVEQDVYACIAVGALVAVLPGLDIWRRFKDQVRARFAYAPEFALAACFALLLLAIGKISTSTFNPFLYFRF